MKISRYLPHLKAQGFTLIELLVAMVIAGIMLTLVMASYWTFLQTQEKMAVSRELQSEVRFALNRLTDKIRSTAINYPEYDASVLDYFCDEPNKKLCLINKNKTPNENYYFEFDDTAKSLKMGHNKTNLQPLLSPGKFLVDRVHFDFSPKLDPTNLLNPQMQPKVTIFIRVSPRDQRYQNLVIENQTTISSRQY